MNEPVVEELFPKSSSLYIFFGGISAGIIVPPLEFYTASKILDENKIFIRDYNQCWYQRGLPGISTDVRSTAQFIRGRIKALEPDSVFFVGNSMGGFAAILFALLVGTGSAIAFAPQTFISPLLRLRHRDHRWSKRIFATYRATIFKRTIMDVRPSLLHSNRVTPITVFVSRDDVLDRVHAHHIHDIPGVTVHECDGGGHGIVQKLRDQGELPAIMAGTYPCPDTATKLKHRMLHLTIALGTMLSGQANSGSFSRNAP